jgi:hypothetical protein
VWGENGGGGGGADIISQDHGFIVVQGTSRLLMLLLY